MFTKPAKLVSGILLMSSVTLSSCAVPLVTLFNADNPADALGVGESSNVHFFTSVANFDTELNLGAGNTYEMDIAILSHWIDSDIDENENGEPLNEFGFANSVMPLEAFGMTRRSRNHQWFELMMYQANCGRESLRGVSDLNYDEASGSYRFVATCDGNLRLFVNDSPGFYVNNAGYANIKLSRVN